MKEFLVSLFDFFLPRVCVSCDTKLLTSENSLCDTCFDKIERVDPQFLISEYKRKFKSENIIKDFTSLFIFHEDTPIQHLMHELKYSKKFRLGNYLGNLLAKNLGEKIINWNADLIIPVPLHKLKKAERGFNQSFYIAKGLGNNLGIKINTSVIKRNRFTQTQTKLNSEERKENLKDAFVIKHSKAIKDKNIILLDDVITTGATISECAQVLKQNGAKNLCAVSAAIAN